MYKMIESRRNFINTDNVKALVSMEDAWKRAAVAQVDPQCKKPCPRLEDLEHRTLTVQSHDAGSVKTLVNLPSSHPNWQEVSIREPEWDGTGGNHQTPSQRNGLLDDSTNGTSKSKQEKQGESEVRREAGGHIMKEIAGAERRKNEHSRWKLNAGRKKKKEKHTLEVFCTQKAQITKR